MMFDPTRMQNLDATQVGTIGEYLVASIVGGFGYEVIHSPAKGFDLLVLPPDERSMPVRVDVKTKSTSNSQRTYSIRRGKTTTFRDYEAGACDLFALVCLEEMAISFVPCEDYDGKGTIYINPNAHRATDPYESWVKALSATELANSFLNERTNNIKKRNTTGDQLSLSL